MGQVAVGLVREGRAQDLADLLRAPAPVQVLLDELLQLRIAAYLSFLGAGAAQGRSSLGLAQAVLAGARVAVAAHLTADRGRVPAELAGDGAQGLLGPQQVGDDDPLVLRQEPRRARAGVPFLGDGQVDVLPAGPVDDLPSVPPPVPRLAVDAHLSARGRVTQSLRHEPKVLVTLLGQRGRSTLLIGPPRLGQCNTPQGLVLRPPLEPKRFAGAREVVHSQSPL